MSTRLFSSAIFGIDARLIEVEADSSPGLHTFTVVGLPDKAIQESKDRISSAIKNSGFSAPNKKHKKIIVNLAPADFKKEGPSYDLPIALSYLSETGQLKFDPSGIMFVGELSLDGSIKHTNGILSAAILAKNKGFKEIIVPKSNATEASVVPGLNVIGVSSVKETVEYLTDVIKISPVKPVKPEEREEAQKLTLLESIQGQESAKRAITIASAGFHNVLMWGPPGSGKTILARALTELLPPMSSEESLEVARIYSSLGLLKGNPLSLPRPFRSPHHSASAPAIVGGGVSPQPGEISLAHRGVLFMDEFPEFPRNVMEALRQPMEEGRITISRALGTVELPAKVMLVAAMNPCQCGNHGDERASCICPPLSILKYRKKVSGPILDRMDIQINVPRETITPKSNLVTSGQAPKNDSVISGQAKTVKNGSDTEGLRRKIVSAREIQLARFKNSEIFSNSEINYTNIDKYCVLSPEAEEMLDKAANSKALSLRAYHKIKKLARTIADLEGSELIGGQHVAEAIGLRINEKLMSDLI